MATGKKRAGHHPARRRPHDDRHALGDEAPAQAPPLGRRIYTFSISLSGSMADNIWQDFLSEITLAMGMNKVSKPAKWRYPINGNGGNGMTLVQPITESFLALDTWPDHCGAYLFICSCKPFSPPSLRPVFKKFGLLNGHFISGSLGLDPP